jgi:serine/threonine protein kinase
VTIARYFAHEAGRSVYQLLQEFGPERTFDMCMACIHPVATALLALQNSAGPAMHRLHLDVKPENVLLDVPATSSATTSNFCVRLGDFDAVADIPEDPDAPGQPAWSVSLPCPRGTKHFGPGELKHNSANQLSDVYSFGKLAEWVLSAGYEAARKCAPALARMILLQLHACHGACHKPSIRCNANTDVFVRYTVQRRSSTCLPCA